MPGTHPAALNRKDIIHGIEDACADDALWLIPAITEYIKETGDLAFADHPEIESGELDVIGAVYDIETGRVEWLTEG